MAELPAYLKQSAGPRLSEGLVENLGAGAPAFISIMGNKFKLVDSTGAQEAVESYDPKTGPYLDCVIIDANKHLSNVFWGHDFDPGAGNWSPPECWSDNGVAPSINATLPQAASCTPDEDGSHGGCKWAVWGSATSKASGKGVRACRQLQKLAVIIPGDDITFLLRVPPNSLRNLKNYTLKFVNQNFDLKDVLTRVSFEPDQLGTLQFSAVGFIDQATYKQREEALTEGTAQIVGRNDKPRQGMLMPPVSQPVTGTGHEPVGAVPMHQPSPEPAKRKRRTKAEMAAAAGNGQTTQAPVEAPASPFGIAAGVEPLPELKQGLDAIFGRK